MHIPARRHARLTPSHCSDEPHRTRRHTMLFAAALTAVGVLGGATTVAAAPLDSGRFHDSGSELHEGECGIDLVYTWDISGSFLGVALGSDSLVHYRDSIHGTRTFTNVATGRSYTNVYSAASRDHKVTDNGDGTLTITVQASGTDKWYDSDGKLVLMDPGLLRWQILVDNAGTPSDPSDDDFIEFLGTVKDSTGRNDLDGRDFCEDLLLFTA